MTTGATPAEPHDGFIRRVIAMWRAEIDVAWNWPHGRFHLLRRIVSHIVFGGLLLWLVAWILPGIKFDTPWSAPLVVAVAGAIYLTVRPAAFILVRGHDNLTLLLALTIDTLTLLFVGWLDIGLTVGFFAALVAGMLMTAIRVVLEAFLQIDESETFYRNVTLKLARQGRPDVDTNTPGVVVIQIDGLSAPVFRMVVRTGQMPFVASWIRKGNHRLLDWETGLPSMTTASQAGILHGNNFDIPAFRWYEKDRHKLMVSNNPRDAAEIEARVTGEHNLLVGGTSISNLLSGGADRAIATTSRLGARSAQAGSVTENLSTYLARPNRVFRLITLTLGEVLKEWMQAWKQRRRGIDPRMDRSGSFPLLRASTTIVMPDLTTELIIEDMERGVPIIYADILGYDEVAHHAGPERPDAIEELQNIDRCIRTLVQASERSRRPYRFVLLSDHGQSQGETFEVRFGVSLQSLVKSFVGGDVDVLPATDNVESWSTINAVVNQIAHEGGATGAVTNQLTKRRAEDGYVNFGPGSKANGKPADSVEDVVVTASGNLALIYFNASPVRLTFEEIEALYPGLVGRLAAHPGISFVTVESEQLGTIAMGADGVHRLRDGTIEGEDPLAPFGPNVPAHLLRLSTFPHVGDIVVNSLVDAETEEVAPFEKLIGAHGGLGGPQTHPFVLIPSEWEPPTGPIVGAERLNELLRGWIASLAPTP